MLTENKFWNIVESVDWDSYINKTDKIDFDQHKVQIILDLGCEPDLIDEFHALYQEKDKAVRNTINEFEDETNKILGVSDDGFLDLSSHIVGLGRQEYQKHIQDPWLIYERAQNRSYRECFAYVVPYKKEYEELTSLDTYVSRAQRIIRNTPRSRTRAFSELQEILASFIESKDVQKFVDQKEEILQLQRDLDAMWSVKNLVHDIETYYLPLTIS